MYQYIGRLYKEQARSYDLDPVASEREFEKVIKYVIDQKERMVKAQGRRPFP